MKQDKVLFQNFFTAADSYPPHNTKGMLDQKLTATAFSEIPRIASNVNLSKEASPDDLFVCFKHFLRFGKLFGTVPLDGIFGTNLADLRFRWRSPGTIYSILTMGLLISNLTFSLMYLFDIGGNNAIEWATNGRYFVFYSMGVFTQAYFLLRGNYLVRVFHVWTEVELHFTKVDSNLFRDANVIAIGVFASAIIENLLSQVLTVFFSSEMELLDHPLLRFYKNDGQHWAEFLPYNDVIVIVIFVSNKIALYAWNFFDILVILMSRALYYKFKNLNQVFYEKTRSKCVWESPETWKMLVKDHNTVCDLLKVFENFLSPLLFVSYSINCFYICLQLHLALSKGHVKSLAENVHVVWSFGHLVMRVFLVSLIGAKIHDHAHDVLELLYLCPESCDSMEVKRARWRIGSKKIGLSGLGCFVVTRPFMLKLISVIFTFEIVLLHSPEAN